MTPFRSSLRRAAPSGLTALLVLLALAGCGAPARDEAQPAQPIVEREAVVFPEGSPQVETIVTVPARARGDGRLEVNGRLAWDEDRTVRVSSPFAGRVADIRVRAGDRVQAGQPLATLASPEIGQAQADARRAEAEAALARKNLDRVDALHGAGVAPAKDLHAAQADLDRALAERARAGERLKLYRASPDAIDQQFVLRAPIPGIVVERNLNPGQEVRADQPPANGIFTITDPTRLWFVLDIAERDVGAFVPGTQVELRPAAQADVVVTGSVTQVADAVDPTTRTVKVRGTCRNADRRLKAEMFVVARVATANPGGLVVPMRAVYLNGDRHYVFVASGVGRFERRVVRLGPAGNGDQVVLEGVAPDDQVVVDGNLLLERIHAAKRPTMSATGH